MAATVLAVVAFAGSFTHVQETVSLHGQHGWLSWAIAAMPELMVGLCVWKVTARTADAWTWIVGVSAVAFTLAANLAQAEPSPWGWVVAGWPAWAAVGSVKLIGHGPRKVQAQRVKAERQSTREMGHSTREAARPVAPAEPAAKAAKLTPSQEVVLAAMAGQGEMSMGKIVLASGRPRSTVKLAIAALAKAGHVANTRDGHYRAAA